MDLFSCLFFSFLTAIPPLSNNLRSDPVPMQSSCISLLTAFKMPAVRWGTQVLPQQLCSEVRTVKVDTLALELELELACLLPVKYPRYHGCSAVRYLPPTSLSS